MLGTLVGPASSLKHNCAHDSSNFALVLNTSMPRVPPESNCLRNRINPLLGPPPFLISDAVQRSMMG
jgi:hypothetical protein